MIKKAWNWITGLFKKDKKEEVYVAPIEVSAPVETVVLAESGDQDFEPIPIEEQEELSPNVEWDDTVWKEFEDAWEEPAIDETIIEKEILPDESIEPIKPEKLAKPPKNTGIEGSLHLGFPW